MERLRTLIEVARKEFLAAADPSFIHHAQYSKELPQKNLGGSLYQGLKIVRVGNYKHVEVTFLTGSASFPGDKTYEQKIILEELFPLLKAKRSDLNLRKKVMKALNTGDLRIGCSCDCFRFWGYAFIITKLGAQHPEFKELRPPKVRNPQQRGAICKHLNLVLTVAPFNAMDMVKDLHDLGY